MLRDLLRRWLGVHQNSVNIEILLLAIDKDRKLTTAQFTTLLSTITTQNRAIARLLTKIDPAYAPTSPLNEPTPDP